MSWRIRAYLAVLAFRYFGSAWAIAQSKDLFEQSALFEYVFRIAPPDWWVVGFVLFGIVAVGAVLRPRILGIRAVLLVSVYLSSLWAGAFVAAELLEDIPATLGTVLLLSLAAKDFIVSSMPAMVNPLEVIVKRDEGEDKS